MEESGTVAKAPTDAGAQNTPMQASWPKDTPKVHHGQWRQQPQTTMTGDTPSPVIMAPVAAVAHPYPQAGG